MKGKGLSLKLITETASQLIEEKGYENFSVRELAVALNVKAASLYNHINGVGDITREVGALAAGKLNVAITEAVGDQTRDAALRAAFFAYRRFAQENPELYRAIIGLPVLDSGGKLRDIRKLSVDALKIIVGEYGVSEKTGICFLREIRSALHGFVTLEAVGYFSSTDVNTDESFRFLVDGAVDRIDRLESAYQNLTGEK